MRTVTLWLVLLSSVLLLAGCRSSKMVKGASAAMMSPTADSAVVVFLRPSSFGGGIQSSVFDATTSQNEFIGIVSSGAKVQYRAKPGEHMFMVVSEAADFLKATLDANKTYYVLVTPRMGMWRARFSLKPVRTEDPKGTRLEGWNRSCALYENSDKARLWAVENAPSIQHKREEYMKKWEKKTPKDKEESTVFATDGR